MLRVVDQHPAQSLLANPESSLQREAWVRPLELGSPKVFPQSQALW